MLLTLLPLYFPPEGGFLARLACVRHAASVRSEPVSYPSREYVRLALPASKPACRTVSLWLCVHGSSSPLHAARSLAGVPNLHRLLFVKEHTAPSSAYYTAPRFSVKRQVRRRPFRTPPSASPSRALQPKRRQSVPAPVSFKELRPTLQLCQKTSVRLEWACPRGRNGPAARQESEPPVRISPAARFAQSIRAALPCQETRKRKREHSPRRPTAKLRKASIARMKAPRGPFWDPLKPSPPLSDSAPRAPHAVRRRRPAPHLGIPSHRRAPAWPWHLVRENEALPRGSPY